MTPKTDLQRLFDAALKDTSDIDQKKLRLTPTAPVTRVEAISITSPLLTKPIAAVVTEQPLDEESPTVDLDFDKQLADELGAQLDAKMDKQRRQRRRATLLTIAAVVTVVGGSYAWCVQSPERIEAFHKVMKDVRSATNVTNMVASYQESLNKVAERGEQIDNSTESMGMSADQEGMDDVYLDVEMKEMIGEEAKTIGARNAKVADKFNAWKEKAE